MKKRADIILLEKNLANSRSKAQAMIMAGQVFVNGIKIKKSGEIIDSESMTSIRLSILIFAILQLCVLSWMLVDLQVQVCHRNLPQKAIAEYKKKNMGKFTNTYDERRPTGWSP